MNELIYNIVSFVAGLLIGVYANANIILPLLYGLPRAIRGVFYGELRPASIPFQLVAPLFWCALFVGAGFFMAAFAPSLLHHTARNAAFGLGNWVSVALMLLAFFRPASRADMADDFERSTVARFATHTATRA
jgi:hypothetical protein